MKIFTLTKIQKLPIDLKTAWDFFSSPLNLEKITPPKLRMRVTSQLPQKMYSGLIITYSVSPLLIPMTWVTEIKNVIEGQVFVDEQRFGPYAFWHHQHWFKEIPGGVEMTDIVNYAPPLSLISSVINKIIVAPELETIFSYRSQVLEKTFGKL